MPPRHAFRLFAAARSNGVASATIRNRVQTPFQRRFQSADATNTSTESALAKFWKSPVGPKTVHFWAPIMKWSIVLAGIADLGRPAENLSFTQNLALVATGAIWTRWCLIIKPRNVFLATVNFFLFLVGTTQVTRILLWRQSQKDGTLTEAVKDEARQQKETVKSEAKAVEQKVKEAIK